ncbi:putative reverse transcriptase domain-containing protein [Tanacetum coccineum]|uniref:Reverse transcriptase domain-containing protein n=1 Tax=Tanacetum coccineum TaxID=301880 RepID=A0ABQ5AKV6_9ASTR
MTDKYCPRGEKKKLEVELWNLKGKGTNVIDYNQHFQELALLCVRMFLEESDKIKRYESCTFAERQTENKRKQDDNQQQQHQQNKRSPANANTGNNQRGNRAGHKPTCYECGAQGHFKRECPKLKNNNRGNQGGNGNAPAKVYAVGHAGTKPRLKHRYGSQIDITPSTLDYYYDVELADGRIIGLNAIIRGCTLNFLNHLFNIGLMPVELGSLDVIIDMDWLAKYQDVIVSAEKIVRIPWGNETLIVCGDRSDQGNETRLNIISCTKTQKYMLKGCPIFLAYVTTKETEDKSHRRSDLRMHRSFKIFLNYFTESIVGVSLRLPHDKWKSKSS